MKRSRIGTSKASRDRRKERVAKDAAWSNAVRDRDEGVCQRCRHEGHHAHHVAQRSQRSDLVHDVDNGIYLCWLCHDWVHKHPLEAREQGFLSDETYEKANALQNQI